MIDMRCGLNEQDQGIRVASKNTEGKHEQGSENNMNKAEKLCEEVLFSTW